MAPMQLHWDIFCRVIDNFGDIGICWRLARQLAGEHGRQVRLWVDDLAALKPLCPVVDTALLRQSIAGVEINRWTDPLPTNGREAEVVIEAFACELPPDYLQGMSLAAIRPVWINLEYLTAESWAEGCHGMASPHPSLPLVKYFYFPGFTANTGGLIREHDWESRFSQPTNEPVALSASLFCYDTAPVAQWLEEAAAGTKPMICHVAAGQPLSAVQGVLGGSAPWRHGVLRIESSPFLPMDDYDSLLACSAVNFVRGEDSFVRAQWAGRPFIWQAYRQDGDAHLDKLEAFLQRYCADMGSSLRHVVEAMFRSWNTGEGVANAWRNFVYSLPEIDRHNREWARQLARQDDLATGLVKFCANKV